MIEIGFWRETQSGPSRLPHPSDHVDTGWDATEREIVALYLDNGAIITQYLGWSYCRFDCGAGPEMGSADLGDGTYLWPQGYSHYVRKHGVRPPDKFIAHVFEVTGIPRR